MSGRWLWAAFALVVIGGAIVVFGGYADVRNAMAPFEEQAPQSTAEAYERLGALQPRHRSKYERWQWVDALFVLCNTSAMGIVCVVAKHRFGWGRSWIFVCTGLILALVTGEAMENVAIVAIINGHDQLGLLRVGAGIKWVAFPIGATMCVVLLFALGVARLRIMLQKPKAAA